MVFAEHEHTAVVSIRKCIGLYTNRSLKQHVPPRPTQFLSPCFCIFFKQLLWRTGFSLTVFI